MLRHVMFCNDPVLLSLFLSKLPECLFQAEYSLDVFVEHKNRHLIPEMQEVEESHNQWIERFAIHDNREMREWAHSMPGLTDRAHRAIDRYDLSMKTFLPAWMTKNSTAGDRFMYSDDDILMLRDPSWFWWRDGRSATHHSFDGYRVENDRHWDELCGLCDVFGRDPVDFSADCYNRLRSDSGIWTHDAKFGPSYDRMIELLARFYDHELFGYELAEGNLTNTQRLFDQRFLTMLFTEPGFTDGDGYKSFDKKDGAMIFVQKFDKFVQGDPNRPYRPTKWPTFMHWGGGRKHLYADYFSRMIDVDQVAADVARETQR